MTQQRPSERLRVDVPTLEPDPAFLGMLVHLSAGSQTATHRSTRSAGFRMMLATGSVAVIAAATWAAGVPTGGGDPHSPADSPTRIGPSGTPSPGDVGTPHSDASTPPGSPLSPGLPGSSSSSSPDHATDPRGDGEGKGRDLGSKGGSDGRPKDKSNPSKGDKAKGHPKGPSTDKPADQDRGPEAATPPDDTVDNLLKGVLEDPAGTKGNDDPRDDERRPTH